VGYHIASLFLDNKKGKKPRQLPQKYRNSKLQFYPTNQNTPYEVNLRQNLKKIHLQLDMCPLSDPKDFPKAKAAWAHTPSNLVLVWLVVSLPLVLWDAGYVLLRPHSMPGGKYHWPLWAPYELYGKTDYIYGWKAYNEKNGFTAALAFMNLIETAGYFTYFGLLLKHSVARGRGEPNNPGWLGQQRSLTGEKAACAALVGYSSAILTLAKTMLYCKCPVRCLFRMT
jgi:hypothetical protein